MSKEEAAGFWKGDVGAANWHSQRLEFLGDSVLKFLAGMWVFAMLGPEWGEGALSEKAQTLQSNSVLRRAVKEAKLDSAVLTKNYNKTMTLADQRMQVASGKMQADIFESLVGALYLSGHLDVDRSVDNSIEGGSPCQTRLVGSNSGFLFSAAFIDSYLRTALEEIHPATGQETAHVLRYLRSGGWLQRRGDTESSAAPVPPQADSTFRRILAGSKLAGAAAKDIDALQGTSYVSASRLSEAWGHTFRNPELLWCARVHKSMAAEYGLSYERFEFLGDAILAPLVVEFLYRKFPTFREGPLSAAKSVLLSNLFLALKMARRLDRRNVPLEAALVSQAEVGQTALNEEMNERIRSHKPEHRADFAFVASRIFGKARNEEEAPTRKPRLADLYEALVAVTAIDCRFDLEAVWDVLEEDFLEEDFLQEVRDFLQEESKVEATE
eukprot:GHVU01216856.1.p1 GENE.GHVU01216856.1~~GHVU01216856.1.p1  ORF type:complete len:479 (-),score=74.87 GHVU01216856.1:333-1652(-)